MHRVQLHPATQGGFPTGVQYRNMTVRLLSSLIDIPEISWRQEMRYACITPVSSLQSHWRFCYSDDLSKHLFSEDYANSCTDEFLL